MNATIQSHSLHSDASEGGKRKCVGCAYYFQVLKRKENCNDHPLSDICFVLKDISFKHNPSPRLKCASDIIKTSKAHNIFLSIGIDLTAWFFTKTKKTKTHFLCFDPLDLIVFNYDQNFNT